MSQRISPATTGSVWPALILTAVLSAPAWAGDPNQTTEPNTPPVQKPTAQTIVAPPRQPVPPPARGSAALTRDMPFSQAIDILRHATTPPLNIIVLWRDIAENAGVRRETPIGIDGVPGLRIGQCLDLLMLSLSAGAPAKLGYVVRHGAVTIATTDTLAVSKPVPRIYDISDLVAPPARYFGSPFGLGGWGLGGMGYGGMGYGGMGLGGMGYGGVGYGGAGYGGPTMAPFGGFSPGFGTGFTGTPPGSPPYRRR